MSATKFHWYSRATRLGMILVFIPIPGTGPLRFQAGEKRGAAARLACNGSLFMRLQRWRRPSRDWLTGVIMCIRKAWGWDLHRAHRSIGMLTRIVPKGLHRIMIEARSDDGWDVSEWNIFRPGIEGG